jgi:hypothetical protein
VGTYSPAGATRCNQCPKGQFDRDLDPSTPCTDCTTGEYLNFSAGGGGACQPCPAGKADTDKSSRTACVACSRGQYSVAASVQCVTCAAGQVDHDASSATPCQSCVVGQYWNASGINGSTCDMCAAGFADVDRDSMSECVACSVGTYSSIGTADCTSCPKGKFDSDNNSATPCDACSPGRHWDAAQPTGRSCVLCAAGLADTDSDAMTACESCGVGTYSASGSTRCDACSSGETDHDSDPSTPCMGCVPGTIYDGITCKRCDEGKADLDKKSKRCQQCPKGTYSHAGATTCETCQSRGLGWKDNDGDPSTPCVNSAQSSKCTQQCSIGYEDADCDASSNCTACTEGQYSAGQLARCGPCAHGKYASRGARPSECTACPSSTADEDNNAWTQCSECGEGTFTSEAHTTVFVNSSAARCLPCLPGTVDTDGKASTPCDPCAIGTFNPKNGSHQTADCLPCALGRWSAALAAAICEQCQSDFYRGPSTLGGCIACTDFPGQRCDGLGTIFPKAAPGYYAESQRDEANVSRPVACVPPEACLGTCPYDAQLQLSTTDPLVRELKWAEVQLLAQCNGSLGNESCSPGYTGLRCSICEPFDPAVDCKLKQNGYYRRDQRCEPCPCTKITFAMQVGALMVVVVAMLLLIDLFNTDASEHASTVAAPFLIMVNFCQTIALFLDLDVRWPKQLRAVMAWFSWLNINLELVRPECTMPFGAKQKMWLTLSVPPFILAVIAIYSILKWIWVHLRHRGQTHKTLGKFLHNKAVTILSTLFLVCSVFFMKSVLRPLDCKIDQETGRSFVQSSPEVECDRANDPLYQELLMMGLAGLCAYVITFCVLTSSLVHAGNSVEHGMGSLAFLGDKYENEFAYCE